MSLRSRRFNLPRARPVFVPWVAALALALSVVLGLWVHSQLSSADEAVQQRRQVYHHHIEREVAAWQELGDRQRALSRLQHLDATSAVASDGALRRSEAAKKLERRRIEEKAANAEAARLQSDQARRALAMEEDRARSVRTRTRRGGMIGGAAVAALGVVVLLGLRSRTVAVVVEQHAVSVGDHRIAFEELARCEFTRGRLVFTSTDRTTWSTHRVHSSPLVKDLVQLVQSLQLDLGELREAAAARQRADAQLEDLLDAARGSD